MVLSTRSEKHAVVPFIPDLLGRGQLDKSFDLEEAEKQLPLTVSNFLCFQHWASGQIAPLCQSASSCSCLRFKPTSLEEVEKPKQLLHAVLLRR